jgi:hypothetical protein
MSFKSILEQVIPCWYELSWHENDSSILFRIHSDFIKNLGKPLNKDAPIIQHLRKDFGFGEFGCDFNKSIGFNGSFRRVGEREGFIEYSVKLPRIKKENGKCESCKGKGEDELVESKCFSCNGSGKKYKYEWKLAYQISASFTVFFHLLSYSEKDTSSSFPQLMTIQTVTQKESHHGGSLGGEISISLRNWLKGFGQNDHQQMPEMVKAMRIAYDAMIPLEEYNLHDFNAYIRKGGFFIADCPGEACGLNPSTWHDMKDMGNQFSCHNTDTPVQQITLLAGLAVMHDKARKEMVSLKV